MTLLELLVVIAIIAILFVVLGPAVQMAREAGRRSTCANNLHQIGLAIHVYQSTHAVLPAGSLLRSRFSWLSMLLPYLDQPNLYSTINFDLGYGDRENLTARANHLDVFLCPADVRAQATPATNYAGNTGDVYPATSQNGSFSNVGEHFSFADFVDGTHSTIAASEWVKGSLGQSIGLAENIFPTPPLPTLDEFASHCANVNVTTSGFDASKGFEWIYGEMGRTLYNHVLGPNQPSCTNNGRVQQGAYSASSRHPAGVHSLFVDGHVKFISETIDLRIWRALGTRRGGESVDEF